MTKCTCTTIRNKGTNRPDARFANPECPTHPPKAPGQVGGFPPPGVDPVRITRKIATLDRVIERLKSQRARLVAKMERAST